jgi:hypothetical protein
MYISVLPGSRHSRHRNKSKFTACYTRKGKRIGNKRDRKKNNKEVSNKEET